jgi:hypothetical protein
MVHLRPDTEFCTPLLSVARPSVTRDILAGGASRLAALLLRAWPSGRGAPRLMPRITDTGRKAPAAAGACASQRAALCPIRPSSVSTRGRRSTEPDPENHALIQDSAGLNAALDYLPGAINSSCAT